jgi:hypothetical protein
MLMDRGAPPDSRPDSLVSLKLLWVWVFCAASILMLLPAASVTFCSPMTLEPLRLMSWAAPTVTLTPPAVVPTALVWVWLRRSVVLVLLKRSDSLVVLPERVLLVCWPAFK